LFEGKLVKPQEGGRTLNAIDWLATANKFPLSE
jgi:hypothetical protein